MAEREYLALIFIFCLGITSPHLAYASAYVPSKGKYKIAITGQFSDGSTRSFIKRKEKRYNQISRQIDTLGDDKFVVDNLPTSENANNPGSVADTGLPKAVIEAQKSALRAELELLQQYTDLYFGNSSIEYGLGDAASFGGSFAGQKQGFPKDTENLYSGAVFFKKQLYNKKRRGKQMIFTTQAKLLFDRHNSSSKTFGEIGFYFAFPRKIKIRGSKRAGKKREIGELITEYSLYGGFPLSNGADKDESYFAIGLGKVLKNKRGWFVSQYQRISRCNTSKKAYKNTFYSKTSIGKEIIFKDNTNLTLEIGYFKNKSQNYERIQITGVCFSMRMEG